MKVFKNKEEVRLALREISSLDYSEHPKVFKAMVSELDHGGVSKKEFKEIVVDLKKNHEISDIDARNLLKLLK